MTELKRLRKIEEFVLERLKAYGLNTVLQKFDIISEDRMLALIARRLPNNFSFWQTGRDYERFRTRFEHGFGHGILEVVFNLDPSRAFILNTVPFASKVLTVCHVYGHNHFFSNNAYFRHTRRNMLSSASAARERFLEYEKRFGINKVEEILNAAKAFEVNVDPDLGRLPETQEHMRKRLLVAIVEIPENDQTLKPLSKKMKKEQADLKEELESGKLVFAERDILLFILEN
ncbi:MAG: hypothetical protein A3J46_04845 [Candidatus Yanofskybacteria bacterium RIFCSPHIGHO2_02_FULL_41_11]|uniref:SpoVR protein-like N-terminal domain-containing protein n=1 Tax=Candidatus Yanofskybacteria bacterium RIFCSPHIGHO2_02_FULL_41_11 TaxID=1802675 RepID=A0A1F8F894_9BACT|nr:MAG: hypothetical protein A3J46_04845 [Candidatus Yanofskybacteria bacterium RIFCSPHIGHO2_02_FULL_41_11]